MTFIGIDPGQSGGIGVINDSGPSCFKMPETERDIHDLLKTILEEYSKQTVSGYLSVGNDVTLVGIKAVIEQVHSMPKQGVASSFKFGMSYGALRMALIGVGIPFETVTPQRWQKTLQCLSKGDKNVTKRKAQELFPQLKITHATADALLLSEYARRTSK